MLYGKGVPQWLCLLVGFVMPIGVALFNGLMCEYLNLLPLILTLGTTSILIALGRC